MAKPLGKGCAALFGLIFVISGVALCYIGYFHLGKRIREIQNWSQVPCKLNSFATKIIPKPGNEVFEFNADVSYTYEVGGKSYRGTIYDASNATDGDVNELEQKGHELRKSSAPTCLVNPENPEDSSLVRPTNFIVWLLTGMGGVFALVGLMVVFKGGSRSGSSPRKGGLPIIFGLLFLTAGILILWLGILNRPDHKKRESAMVEVPCTVIASGVHTHTSSGKKSKTTYKARIAFSYQYDSRTWHSSWPNFDAGSTSSSNSSAAHSLAHKFPQGKRVSCWVDPQQPWVAVLEKNEGGRMLLWLLAIVFGGIGLIVTVISVLKILAVGAAVVMPLSPETPPPPPSPPPAPGPPPLPPA